MFIIFFKSPNDPTGGWTRVNVQFILLTPMGENHQKALGFRRVLGGDVTFFENGNVVKKQNKM